MIFLAIWDYYVSIVSLLLLLSVSCMKMEETAANNNNGSQDLETEFAERSMWLMKCPSLIAPSLEPLPFEDDPYLPVAKVILSIDPLATVDDEDTKVILLFLPFLLLHLGFFWCNKTCDSFAFV